MQSVAWNTLADQSTVDSTIAALQANGIEAIFVETGEDAKKKVLELLPRDAEVMNMTSMTLEGIGLVKEILESGRFQPVRAKFKNLDEATQGQEKRRLGAAPDWVVGSVHAITATGQVMVASQSGSQFPAYAYGAAHVLWVAGTHKIVPTIEAGMKRIYEYNLPLENERSMKAYGEGSGVNKILIVNNEIKPNRITMILVNEVLGF